MKMEEQALTREQLFSLRDYHLKAADDGLGRIILAILAGAGSGLVFLANSPIAASGSGVRGFGLLASAALLTAVVASFMALLSSRNHHLVEQSGYVLRIQKEDFKRDFAPHVSAETAAEILQFQNQTLNNFYQFRRKSEDQAQRFVRWATAATAIGIAIVVGIYWYAPPSVGQAATPKIRTSAVEATAPKKGDRPA
jgi:hypothetical protein